ncbi:helix-turn-helix transcriptional regulator [Neptunicoccus sediminis]|uniref:helix-turn-helix transcriptional regulator n=1 Tax=Neptunicoccus sediminis TaxID=1892596 RepID=UPI001C12BFF3|nr:LuxR C-terminal-related transcriptional regulator [Neptunicoccus sediminis]
MKTVCESASAIGATGDGDIVILHDPTSVAEARADIETLHRATSNLKIILVPTSEQLEVYFAEFNNTVAAIIPDGSSAEAFLSAVIMVSEGFTISASISRDAIHKVKPSELVDTGVAEGEPDNRVVASLSDREKKVLQLLALGASNKAIALELGIAEATVKSHLRSSFLKIGCKNRALAAVWASINL